MVPKFMVGSMVFVPHHLGLFPSLWAQSHSEAMSNALTSTFGMAKVFQGHLFIIPQQKWAYHTILGGYSMRYSVGYRWNI
jgi:hypothetical protein